MEQLREVDQTGDDRPKTDVDELTGTKSTYDDIRISRMGIYQGYNSDCTGAASTFTKRVKTATSTSVVPSSTLMWSTVAAT